MVMTDYLISVPKVPNLRVSFLGQIPHRVKKLCQRFAKKIIPFESSYKHKQKIQEHHGIKMSWERGICHQSFKHPAGGNKCTLHDFSDSNIDMQVVILRKLW
jgi:hypothetical protein